MERMDAYLFKKTYCRYCQMTERAALGPFFKELRVVGKNVDCNRGRWVARWEDFCRSMWGRGVTPLVLIRGVFFGGPEQRVPPAVYAEKVRSEISEALDYLRGRDDPGWPEAYHASEIRGELF